MNVCVKIEQLNHLRVACTKCNRMRNINKKLKNYRATHGELQNNAYKYVVSYNIGGTKHEVKNHIDFAS